eukprot:CAMPEP_0113458066 /NCGR_PEP_ID=MMETSP0014_2-20120614/9729_1 /TAXON_ID=2857 /ORGANISM="Nitzschia sp." /LENGTH=650 /DNA_ID=CAMNT_0000349575 /DNA_START=124 /DNA_END=2076 /DNA_ORIENTATION=+ /assembly_acc=CAM_ASM_000159
MEVASTRNAAVVVMMFVLPLLWNTSCWVGHSHAFSFLQVKQNYYHYRSRRMMGDRCHQRVRSTTKFSLLSLSSSSSSPSKETTVDLQKEKDEISTPTPPEKKETVKKIVASMAKSERRAMERNQHDARQLCTKCHRPPVQCVCDALPSSKITTPNTQILILQHPTEFRRKTFSTVPLIKLVLENVQIVVGHNFDLSTKGIKEAIANNSRILLLFPSEDALTLNEEWKKMEERQQRGSVLQPPPMLLSNVKSQQQQHSENNVANRTVLHKTQHQSLEHNNGKNNSTLLVLIDGTWTQAARMARNSPELFKFCQQVQFEKSDNPDDDDDDDGDTSMSIYDAIRKEPDSHCLSTLEACSKALGYLEEPKTAKLVSHHLHAALQSLVDIQLRYTSQSTDPRFVDRSLKVAQRQQRRQELEMELFGVSTAAEEAVVEDGQRSANEKNNDLNDLRQQQQPLLSKSKTNKPMQANNYTVLDDGAILRNLRLEDVPFMNSRWPFRSKKGIKSLTMIERILTQQLLQSPAAAGAAAELSCCIGVFDSPDPVANNAGEYKAPRAFIVQYENGALGMLHVEEEYRRRGYAVALVEEATRRAQTKLNHVNIFHEPVFAFIVDGNTASEQLFTKLGWTMEKQDPNRKRGTGKRRAKRKWFKRN